MMKETVSNKNTLQIVWAIFCIIGIAGASFRNLNISEW